MDNLIFVFIGLGAGACLGINRLILGKISLYQGPALAAFYNCISGAIATLMLILITGENFLTERLTDVPPFAFLGGIIGACFVTLTSWIIEKVGLTKATLFLITGQLLSGTIIDTISKGNISVIKFLGITCILLSWRIKPYNNQTEFKDV